LEEIKMTALRFYNSPLRNSMLDEMLNVLANNEISEKCACGCVAANISENEGAYRIDLSVPGFTREDIKINLEKNVLTIKSEKKSEEEEGKYLRREFTTADFERRFILPKHVDTDKISATAENGILGIVIPKKEQVVEKVTREISIQ